MGVSRYEQKERGHVVFVTSFFKLLNQDSKIAKQ